MYQKCVITHQFVFTMAVDWDSVCLESRTSTNAVVASRVTGCILQDCVPTQANRYGSGHLA